MLPQNTHQHTHCGVFTRAWVHAHAALRRGRCVSWPWLGWARGGDTPRAGLGLDPYLFPHAGGPGPAPGSRPPRQTPPAGGSAARPPPHPCWAGPETGRGTGGTCGEGRGPGKSTGVSKGRSQLRAAGQGPQSERRGVLRAGRSAGPRKKLGKLGVSPVTGGVTTHRVHSGLGDEGLLKSPRWAPWLGAQWPRAGPPVTHTQGACGLAVAQREKWGEGGPVSWYQHQPGVKGGWRSVRAVEVSGGHGPGLGLVQARTISKGASGGRERPAAVSAGPCSVA